MNKDPAVALFVKRAQQLMARQRCDCLVDHILICRLAHTYVDLRIINHILDASCDLAWPSLHPLPVLLAPARLERTGKGASPNTRVVPRVHAGTSSSHLRTRIGQADRSATHTDAQLVQDAKAFDSANGTCCQP